MTRAALGACMTDDIKAQVLGMAPLIAALRRDLHKHPESGWKEYRTAALAARHLLDLGYTVTMGADAVRADARLTAPDPVICARERRRAVAEGADPELVARMGDGLTGLWADLPCPGPDAADGPLIALRFDMDANELLETESPEHVPLREGFASRHAGTMHACGHDGHTAMGMGLAAVLKVLRPRLRGTVRLIFQPAEEDGLGAAPMAAAGAVDGVDRLFGLHLGIQAAHTGDLICGTTRFLATTTFNIHFTGRAAHAGIAPQEGRNALLAACAAALNMHAIPRHGDGASRINIGQFAAGDASNIIPAHATLIGETRGVTSAIDHYMMEEVARISEAAAQMWGCRCRLHRTSECPSGASSPDLIDVVERVARTMGTFTNILHTRDFWASEDFTWLMNRVQEHGGQATYIQLGTDRPAGHHTRRFDFDESALTSGMELLARLVADSLAP